MFFLENIGNLHIFLSEKYHFSQKNDSYRVFFENCLNCSGQNIAKKRLEHLEKSLKPYPKPLDDPQNLYFL